MISLELLADAVPYLTFGIVLHLVADWFFQNDWMANNKAKRRKKAEMWFEPDLEVIAIQRDSKWWDRHPAAYVHAGIHTVIQLLIFPWWAALAIGVLHLLIDLRSPLDWWGEFTRQTRPQGKRVPIDRGGPYPDYEHVPLYDIGMEVAFWRDQTAHFIVLAILALVVAS